MIYQNLLSQLSPLPEILTACSYEYNMALKRNRIWIHPLQWSQVIRDLHKHWRGHYSFHRLWNAAQARFWWPRLRQTFIESHDAYQACQKFSLAKICCPLCPIGTSYTFNTVTIDTAFVIRPSGRVEYFIIAVDYFTRWFESIPYKRTPPTPRPPCSDIQPSFSMDTHENY